MLLTAEEMHQIEKLAIAEIQSESEDKRLYRHLINHRAADAIEVIEDWTAKLLRLRRLIEEQDEEYHKTKGA